MVDTEIFSRRLDALDDYLRRLKHLGRASEAEYLSDPTVHDLAARYLHLVTEAAIDLANHGISDLVLEQAGELDSDLSRRLQGWAGFRNVLVHDYLTVDHRIAWRAIRHDLDDLDAFRRWALGKLGRA